MDGKIFGSQTWHTDLTQSVHHDLKPNIFPSGPPTQSVSAYYSPECRTLLFFGSTSSDNKNQDFVLFSTYNQMTKLHHCKSRQVCMVKNTTFKPFDPRHLDTNSPCWSPYILLTTNWENLFKHQDSLSLMIISSFLMTCMCYVA